MIHSFIEDLTNQTAHDMGPMLQAMICAQLSCWTLRRSHYLETWGLCVKPLFARNYRVGHCEGAIIWIQ